MKLQQCFKDVFNTSPTMLHIFLHDPLQQILLDGFQDTLNSGSIHCQLQQGFKAH